MQLHELHPQHKRKTKKRVGRGGKRGTYSGKGIKGQKSRAGRKMEPMIRQFIKRYPKLRGSGSRKRASISAIVSIEILEKTFDNGAIITPKVLIGKGVISTMKGRIPAVKILGKGNLQKKLTIKGCAISEGAKKAIEKAGGTVRLKTQNAKPKTKNANYKSATGNVKR